ncbi:hypothetical protein DE146DRAFT_681005 [Phaeosphaeria sp. MPI-PUGE-AT-0046c]|nr:hypothetical protein DE146DRAFT_681005 [Phaeosphaeria sp. MPI-PUGE-AT-0046c]
MAETGATTENIADDDLCPICQSLLLTPVRTQCNHLLCASCMAQWADVSNTNRIEPSSWDVDLEDLVRRLRDPNYDPTYDLEANCPMCRTQTAAVPDQKLAKELESKYPTVYAKRKAEEEVERGSRLGQDGVEGIMILIGNKHKRIRDSDDANEHDWTFFVRTSRPELVKHVRVFLHPTFRPPQLTLREAPYAVRRLGWGTFTLEAEIVLKEPYQWIVDSSGPTQPGLELTWPLSFERNGRQGRVRAKVRKTEEPPVDGPRRLRTRSAPAAPLVQNDEDDDEDEDDDYDDEMSSSSEEEEGDNSEFTETSHR